jgi:hypothetical protein
MRIDLYASIYGTFCFDVPGTNKARVVRTTFAASEVIILDIDVFDTDGVKVKFNADTPAEFIVSEVN